VVCIKKKWMSCLVLCYSGPDPAPPTTLSRVAPAPHITRPKVTYSVQDLNQWDGFRLGAGRSFAKFVSKFAMLCIFPLREISCEI
jgi:hypothetical protein